MNRANWPVTEKAARPAGLPDRCFYCDTLIGGDHADDCVMRQRTVVIRVTIDLVVQVPEDWDRELIEHHYNDSSSCSDNVIADIDDLADRLAEDGGCTCGLVEVEYQREATARDEREQGLFVRDCET